MSQFKKLMGIIALSRKELWIVLIYGLAIGMLSLALPIAAQGLVTIVSFGSVRQPLFVLGFAVFILLSAAGVFRLLQNILIEVFQQRIFATTALRIAERLPRLHLVTLDGNHGTELLNRFFDIITIQKATADILLSFTAIILQSILGMLLLAFYHPVLLVFDIVFLACLVLIVYIPFNPAMTTALEESNAKYDVVSWLEEMVRVPFLFHFQNNNKFGIKKADEVTMTYIKARQNHYKNLIIHFCGSYLLQVVASTSLLVIGGLLVLNNQMTLGQLVAAEIVVTALGSSSNKIGRYLEKIYDLLAAAEKVDFLLELPIESNGEQSSSDFIVTTPFVAVPEIKVSNLVVTNAAYLNEGINFIIKPGESVVFVGYKQAGKSRLIEALVGLREPVQGDILYNDMSLKYYSIGSFRKKISFVKYAECFDGTILENILVGREDVAIEEVIAALKACHLYDAILSLEKGVNSYVGGFHQPLSSIQLMKLMFVRALVSKPFIYIFDGAFDLFSKDDLEEMIGALRQLKGESTLIVTTRRQDVAEFFDRRIVL